MSFLDTNQVEPGTPVAVVGVSSIFRTSKVKRVVSRFIELEDGSRWCKDGRVYPKTKYNMHDATHIEMMTDEHREELRREKIIRRIKECNLELVSTKSLEDMYSILKGELNGNC